MSVTGQTQIDLDDGEVERIIRDEEANRAYLVEVTGPNPVRVGHTKRYARDGNTLSGRQTHTVSNLRGEELYAAAFDGPTAIRVRVAAADVESQPQREVTVVEGDVEIESGVLDAILSELEDQRTILNQIDRRTSTDTKRPKRRSPTRS